MRKMISLISIFLCMAGLLADESTQFYMTFNRSKEDDLYFYDGVNPDNKIESITFGPLWGSNINGTFTAEFGVHVEVYEAANIRILLTGSSYDVIDNNPGNMLTSDTPSSGSETSYPVLNYEIHVDGGQGTSLLQSDIDKKDLAISKRQVTLYPAENSAEVGKTDVVIDKKVKFELNPPADGYMGGVYSGYVILSFYTD